jgi:hypothetical protein
MCIRDRDKIEGLVINFLSKLKALVAL